MRSRGEPWLYSPIATTASDPFLRPAPRIAWLSQLRYSSVLKLALNRSVSPEIPNADR